MLARLWLGLSLALWLAAIGCGDAEVAADADTPDVEADADAPDAADPDADRDAAVPDADPDADAAEVDAGPVEGPGLGIDYDATSPGVTPRFDPDSDDWTATPWPSDRYRSPSGAIDLSNAPNPNGTDLLVTYIAHGMQVLDGFGLNGAVYFQLDGPLDDATLPSPEAAMAEDALVQLVNVTPTSARYQQRVPLVFQQRDGAGDPYYLGPTLALRPVYGWPLSEGDVWCAVLTRAVQDTQGRYLQPAPAFAQALADDPALAPLRHWLPSSPFARADLAAATCFTTQRATGELRAVSAFLDTQAPPQLTYVAEPTVWGELQGTYVAPNFQQGDKPYAETGGGLVFGDDGQPVPQLDETLRFLLLFPRDRAMPPAGWPVVTYAHGTTGDYQSCRSTASVLLALGHAVVCIDQPLHGSRGEGLSDGELETFSFNFLNPPAGRTGFRQAAIDTFNLTRMIAAGGFDLAPGDTVSGVELRLDPDRITFYGHSHGALSGSLALAIDPRVTAGLLSGGAGVLVETILRRKDPLDFEALVALLLGVTEADLDTFHPTMSLIQMLVDATDPINYAPYWLAPASGPPKHMFVTEGTLDDASPAVGTDAMAAAAGLPLIGGVAKESEAHALRGLAPQALPVSLNVPTAAGPVTGGLKQWQGGSHFVASTHPEARALWRGFFASLADQQPPVIGYGAPYPVFAPAAAGDACEGDPIAPDALPAFVTADTTLATDAFTTAGCPSAPASGAGRRDVAWRLTPDVDGRYRFELTWPDPDPDDYEAVPVGPDLLSVVTGCGGGAQACLAAAAGTLEVDLLAGQTYHVVVDASPAIPATRGRFTLEVTRVCQVQACGDRECGDFGCGSCGSCGAGQVCSPEGQCLATAAGDTCADALPVGALPFVATGDTLGWAGDYGLQPSTCPGVTFQTGLGSADGVYAFTAPSAGAFTFTLGASFDSLLYVTTDCGDLAAGCLGASRVFSGNDRLVLPLEAGQTVFAVVDGTANVSNAQGAYTLTVDACVPDCAGKACGDDGCGGSCGACQADQRCVTETTCFPLPSLCEATAACQAVDQGDRCADPVLIDALPFQVTASNAGRFDDHAAPAGACPGLSSATGAGAADSVYLLTAPADALYQVTYGSTTSGALYVAADCGDLAGTCEGGLTVGANQAAKSLWVPLEAGEPLVLVAEGAGTHTLKIATCTPSCDGKVCGSDGCGGSCGACGYGQACGGGQCVAQPGYGCQAAIAVSKLPFEHKGTTATSDPFFTGTCGQAPVGAASKDVVYRFTAPAAGDYTARVLGAGWGAALYAIDDCAAAEPICLDAADPAGDPLRLDLTLQDGETVHFVVDGDTGGLTGAAGAYTFQVVPTCVPQCDGKACGPDGCGGVCGQCAAPADVCQADGSCLDPQTVPGNTCALPFEVGALPFQAGGDTRQALNHYGFGEGDCGPFVAKGLGSSEQVWRLTAPADGDYRVSVLPDGFDAALYVVGDCAAVATSCLGASDGQLWETLELPLMAGQQVFVIVDGHDHDADAAGPYTLRVE